MKNIYTYSLLLFALTFISCKTIAQTAKSTDKQEVVEKNEDLQEFVNALKHDIEQHYWESIFSKAAPGHYKTQVFEVGIKKYQYIAEALGLNHVQNNIRLDDQPISKEHLNQIKKVTFDPIKEEQENWLHLTGKVGLTDGRTLALNITIQVVSGRYLLSGAVG